MATPLMPDDGDDPLRAALRQRDSEIGLLAYRLVHARRRAWIARWLTSLAYVLVLGLAVFVAGVDSTLVRVSFGIGLGWTVVAFVVGRPRSVRAEMDRGLGGGSSRTIDDP